MDLSKKTLEAIQIFSDYKDMEKAVEIFEKKLEEAVTQIPQKDMEEYVRITEEMSK